MTLFQLLVCGSQLADTLQTLQTAVENLMKLVDDMKANVKLLSKVCVKHRAKTSIIDHKMLPHARIERGARCPDSPLKNHKVKGFLSNTCPDPLENCKAAKQVFNVRPLLAGQQIAMMARF